MKKRLLLLGLLMVVLVCVFAISISATETTVKNENFKDGVLYKSNKAEFGKINYVVDESLSLVYNDSAFDNTSRVVIKNDDGTYSTFLTRHIMYSPRDAQGPFIYYDKLAALAGQEYGKLKVALIEIPEGTTRVRGSSFTDSTDLIYARVPASADTLKSQVFKGCSNLKTVEFAYDYVKYPKNGSNLQTVANGQVFQGCSSLKELIFPNSLKHIDNGTFTNCTSLTKLVLGASFCEVNQWPSIPTTVTSLILSDDYKINADLFSGGGSNYSMPASFVLYYTGDYDEAVALQKIDTLNWEISHATLVSYETFTSSSFERNQETHYFVYGYNKCDAFYNGAHELDITNCKIGDTCDTCNELIKEENHSIVHTFEYPNGFDNEGVYNYYCANACCKLDGEEKKEIRNKTELPIIVFKGYSVPEKANYKGINAGFEINKNLLALYEKVNNDTVKFNLLMVNSQIGDVNIKQILNGEELAENVKGINIKITSTNYCDIDVSVRGFDDSTEKGNFYTLKLITALAVRTKDSVHYAQGALKNSPNTTIDVGGTAFNIVTANNVYNPKN